jgi:hypothetical protein
MLATRMRLCFIVSNAKYMAEIPFSVTTVMITLIYIHQSQSQTLSYKAKNPLRSLP